MHDNKILSDEEDVNSSFEMKREIYPRNSAEVKECEAF